MDPRKPAAYILGLGGLWLGGGLVLAMAGLTAAGWASSVFAVSRILYESFSFAAWYAPLYLGASAWWVWRGKAGQAFAVASLGVFPVISAALALRIMFTDVAGAPLPQWFVDSFGSSGAVLLTGIATVFFLALLGLIPLMGGRGKADEGGATATDPVPAATEWKNNSNAISQRLADPEKRPPVARYPEEEVLARFRAGMTGKLENRLAKTVAYPDLGEEEDGEPEDPRGDQDAPPTRATPDLAPMKPESPAPVRPPEDSDEPIAVFFSKDGTLSDYPPPDRRAWTTREEGDEEGGAGLDDGDDEEEGDYAGPAATTSPWRANPMSPLVSPEFTAEAPEDEGDDESSGAFSPSRPAIQDQPSPVRDEVVAVEEVVAAPSTPTPVIEAPRPVETVRVPVSQRPTEVHDSREAHEADEVEGDVDTRLLPPLEPGVRAPDPSQPYGVPVEGLLDAPEGTQYWLIDEATTRSAHVLKMTLEEFGIQAEVTGIRKGPVITMFEILPAPGVKLSRITNLADNIALRLAAQSVRIVAPIPGKHAVGIEIPNRDRAKVSFSELLAADSFSSNKVEIPVALGKDITGDAQIIDLAKTPHLLIAGSTGSGKSVCVNALICSILYRRSPAEINLILIDPKIVELKFYNDIPHLLTPVITEPKRAFQALQWCLYEMERRYSLLDAMQVRDIKSFNKKIKSRNIATPHMPYLVIVIDEFADLMATSGKELEGTLARLAAMSRAVGIHLVLATQRPSTDVITGLIKANIPSRIAFMVASKIDSRIIIDSMGAEKLLGKGDMLFTSAWDPFPVRMQGAFLSEEEVERVVSHVKTLGKPDYIDDEIFFDAEDDEDGSGDDDFEGGEDPLMKSAVDIVVSAKKASASYLQRRLKIGYNRAARLIEQMEEKGIVGPANGSKAREILRMFQ